MIQNPSKRLAMSKWDDYYHNICREVAKNSPCLSRKIGAVLVRDNTIIATGYNGPARGIPHCATRHKTDQTISDALRERGYCDDDKLPSCPRQLLDYSSGTGMHLCPATHAEVNCLINCTRTGAMAKGATLYMNSCIPCKDCMSALINAGVETVVVESLTHYDKLSPFIQKHSTVWVRLFDSVTARQHVQYLLP